MAAGVQITLDSREAERLFARAIRELEPSAMTKLIGQEYLSWIAKNFKAGGLERPWAPLSANTIAARRAGRGSGGPQPLQDTGTLRASFVSGHGRNIFRSDAKQVTVGTETDYAEIHEKGAGRFTIRPKNARILSFVTAKGRVFARVVNHPGIKARKMLPSEQLAERLALDVVKAALDKATKEK